jgi:Holliday junction resolvasome RuvABC endonuclease subunit
MGKLSKPVIALGLDPGAVNFGWNLLAARSMEDYVSIEHGVLRSVQSQDYSVTPEFIDPVVEDVLSKVVLGDVKYVIVERYHPRGGTLFGVEYVNVMIGAIMSALASLDVQMWFPTASQWKQKVYSGEGWDHTDWFPKVKVIHAGDAGAMALSMLYQKGVIPWH